MQYKNVLTGLASLLLAAVLVTGCSEPLPSESPDGPVFAAAGATPIAAVMDITGPTPGFPNVTNPECMTVDTETSTAHFKKCIVVGSIAGDLVGTITVELNGRQSLATLVAPNIHGHFTFDGCYADFGCGAFEGPYTGEAAPGGQATLRGNAHGTGDFHTMQFRVTGVERGNTEIFDVDGVIF